ncbi:MAG: S41 family peptidase [Sulfuricaulis sp.]
MKLATRYVLVLFFGIFIGAATFLDMGVQADRDTPKEALAPLPLDELRAFTEVYSRIKSDYVEPVADKKLLNDAVQGMLEGLDPHSAYLDPDAFKDMRVETEGQFGGLGIEVTMDNGFIKVISPIEDTPAARAGVKPGDIIVRLDETAVKGLTLTEAVRLMRGKPGSDIVLTIVREGASKPLKITVTRAVIKIQSVKSRLLGSGFGYVRITEFQAATDKSLVAAVKKLQTDNKAPLRGLVLDLRNNPGGVLNSAVGVGDAFLNKGLIVYTKGRVPDSNLKFFATPGDVLNGAPMVVLINGGSASASEIVSGALQDQKRAIIMGTKSFGKGSVQTIIPMSNGGALKLTTARYYTPSGRSIQDSGIVPDITVEEGKLTLSASDDSLREVDLAHHLVNDKEVAKPKEEQADDKNVTKKNAATSKTDVVEDYQLQQALNVLKGISFFNKQQSN